MAASLEHFDDLEALSVKALKELARARGVDVSRCVEKGDLVAALRAAPAADAVTCAVCLEATAFAALPCCAGATDSTTQFCLECLRLLCEHAGGVGRCPRCRAWIGVEGGAVVAREARATCHVCCQERVIVDGDRVVCGACLLGLRYPLRYECDGCGGVQRIGHPMWRYQARGPGEFGESTWACHRRCGTYTHWRVVPGDVGRVPDDDAPESWGRRDEWLDRIRDYRRRQLRPAEEAPADASDVAPGRCVLS